MKRVLLYQLIIIAIAFSTALSQTTSIEEIHNNPKKFDGNNVIVKGLVTQYVEGTGSTSYYLLKGDYGSIIKVNTAAGAPETNKKYTVEGIVYINEKTGTPFISEKSRNPEEVVSQYGKEDSLTNVTSTPPPPYLLYYILIGAIIILIVTYFILKNKQKSKALTSTYQAPYGSPTESGKGYSVKTGQDIDYENNFRDDFKTVRITTTSPKTLKFIPGKLTIVSGEDTGKSFKIAGYPTPEGNIVSIGREEINGDRSYSHIQLMQKTISRKQAELVQYNGRLYIKNLSETNMTQLNGIELKVGEQAELKSGAVIRLGELEIKYEL